MSRVGDYDGDEYFPNQWALWQRSFELAKNSKRGLKALEDIRAALLALPQKRLISRALCTVGKAEELADEPDRYGERGELLEQGEGVCVVGAYAWYKRVEGGMTADEAFRSLPLGPDYDDPSVTVTEGTKAGLRETLGWWLMQINDDRFEGTDPEARYRGVLQFIEDQIAAHPQNAQAVANA